MRIGDLGIPERSPWHERNLDAWPWRELQWAWCNPIKTLWAVVVLMLAMAAAAT